MDTHTTAVQRALSAPSVHVVSFDLYPKGWRAAWRVLRGMYRVHTAATYTIQSGMLELSHRALTPQEIRNIKYAWLEDR